jgi:hypothetical protein
LDARVRIRAPAPLLIRSVIRAVSMIVGRRHLRLGSLVFLLGITVPAWPAEEQCTLAAPVTTRYRVERNEDEIALTALQFHFDRHSSDKQYRCLTFPGHRTLPPQARAALAGAGLPPDPDKQCHFGEGAIVLAVSGVWLTKPDRYVAHVSRFRFGHLSTFIAEYEYSLTKSSPGWTVASERESPCNPKDERRAP